MFRRSLLVSVVTLLAPACVGAAAARAVIERIASKSSMSGQPYHVKFANGRSMLASQFLGDELKRLEGRAGAG